MGTKSQRCIAQAHQYLAVTCLQNKALFVQPPVGAQVAPQQATQPISKPANTRTTKLNAHQDAGTAHDKNTLWQA
jgi:hypothetical protein